MKKHLTYIIDRQSTSIQRQTVSVPHGLSRLSIMASLEESFRYAANLFIKDADNQVRLQKQLGYGRLAFSIGEYGMNTSTGGVPGVIGEGEWEIYLTVFHEYLEKLPEKTSCEITITITGEAIDICDWLGEDVWFTKEKGLEQDSTGFVWDKLYNLKAQWYKGDFHTHTILSDGKETVKHAMIKAQDCELDFYVPTEHNLMHTGWCDTSLCVIPGIEITTNIGHFNLFGIRKMPEGIWELIRNNGRLDVKAPVEKILKQAKDQGALISINHPFLSVWKWTYHDLLIDKIDCVEIINDPTYINAKESNNEAIRFIDILWGEGYRIYGVGGSDAHNLIEERYENATLPSVAGDPGTYVYCETLTPAVLLEQVKQGAILVTRFCHIEPDIKMANRSYLPGQELIIESPKEDLIYRLVIKGLLECPDVYLVVNGTARDVCVMKTEEGYVAEASVTMKQDEWSFVRMEVRNGERECIGYVNPVYHGLKVPMIKTYGELCQKMERNI